MEKSLFQGLSSGELKKINQSKRVRQYRRREAVFRPGVSPSGLYCIASGQIKLYQTGVEGRDQILRLAGPGDAVGYRALLAGEEYSASAEALTDVNLCFIDRPTLFELIESKPLLMQRMMAWLCQDLRMAEKRLRAFAQKAAHERLAETLILLAELFGKQVSGGIKLDIRLTRQEIGELAGIVLETAVRQLSEFKRRRWIEFQGRSIVIKDQSALSKIARLD